MLSLTRLRRALFGLLLLGLAAGFAAHALAHTILGDTLWMAASALVAAVVAADLIVGLRHGTFGVDIIALLAIVAALVLGERLAGVIIAAMVTGGSALEEFAQARARRELAALVERTPRRTQRREDGAIVAIAVEAIRPGDALLVRSGEIVPADGTVEDEPATLDESALTGEPMPRTHEAGEAVLSGALNVGPPFWLLASASAEESTYAAIVRLVRVAERDRPPMVRLADRWAIVFLAITLAVAGLAWIISRDPVRALAVLVVATPCPLILAAPVALIGGVSRAARRGVIVKGGGALERLARVRTAILDKTGTLTSGTPSVAGVTPIGDFTPTDVLRSAASLEQASQHAVATAIVAAARARRLALTPPVRVTESPGAGLSGLVGERRVLAGSARLMRASGVRLPEDEGPALSREGIVGTVWVAIDWKLAGRVLLTDPVRPEARRALDALRAAGVERLVMASGDHRRAVAATAGELGVDRAHAELTPEAKITLVREERARAPVLMVGDGINDAPALAAADVGIAMGVRGAAAAAEAADAVLMVDRIDRVAEAVAIAVRSRAIALESIGAGMALSVAAMGVAAAGYLPPVAGALLQEAIDVVVILNALRALGGRIPPPDQGEPLSRAAARGRPLGRAAGVQRLVRRPSISIQP